MKIRIDKNELSHLLGKVAPVIDKNPTLPILSNINIVSKNGAIVATTSNGDVSIKAQTETHLDVIEEGTILIDGATLTSAIQKLSGNIVLETKNNQVKISNGIADYKLNATGSQEYPSIDFKESDTMFKVNGNELVEALNKVINSVGTSGERPIFMGVNIQSKGNELVFTATDSYRLSKSYLELDYETELNITILANTLKTIMKIAKDKELFISTDNTRVTFKTDDTIITTRIIDGLYPETDRLIPTDFKTNIIVDRQHLINSVDRASFMREDNVWNLSLQTKGDILTLVTKAQDIGTTFEQVPITLKGEEIEFSLNGKYLLNALQALEDEEVTFNLVGPLQALTVSDSTNQTQLLLPVRIF